MRQEEAITLINGMTHTELARVWRFAKSDSPFIVGQAGLRLSERLFDEFGGFTPEISKEIGWEE